MKKDKYDKMERYKIDPNILYNDVDNEMYSLEKHLDILQGIVNNGVVAGKLILILDHAYGVHRELDIVENYCPMKNTITPFGGGKK